MHTSTHDFADNIVIAVRYLPGFQTDLTSWTLAIDDTGRLTQTLDSVGPLPKKARRAVIQLDHALVLAWVAQAAALDWAALQTLEDSMRIDDMSAYTLMCRFTAVEQSITLCTLDWFVQQHQPDMIAFRTLWDAMHAVAPFSHTRHSPARR